MKEKLKSKSFWLSLVGAALIFAQALGLKVDAPAVNEIVSAVLSLLVVLGIVAAPPPNSATEEESAHEEAKDEDAVEEIPKEIAPKE